MTKIALIGSAPSSVQLAPFNDLSWKVWACSPGAYPLAKRADAWFEIHRYEPPDGYTGPKPWFTKEYIAFMAGLKGPVYMIAPVAEIPNSVAYPKDDMLERFGPYFQTNSLSWMVCLAVASGATEIGLWGVDMAARSEWEDQRIGLQSLLWYVNKHYGVKITLPPESDLWVPPALYGFCEANPQHVKLLTRRAELQQRLAHAQATLEAAKTEYHFISGANDDNEYHIHTWCQDPKALSLAFGGHGQVPPPPIPPAPVDPLANGYAEAALSAQTVVSAPQAANGQWPQA